MNINSTFIKSAKPNRVLSESQEKAISRKAAKKELKRSRKLAANNQALENQYFNDCMLGAE